MELPYGQTRRLRMLIILPAVGVNLKSFVANMTSDELSDWIKDLKPAHVEIGLPRFTATPLCHSSCRLNTSVTLGALRNDSGSIRQRIQRTSGGSAATA